MIKALLFDFDGLILDTETPEFAVWQDLYREYGHEISADQWGQIVGGNGISNFDAARQLWDLTGRTLGIPALKARHSAESLVLIHRQQPRPGVERTLGEARQLGLALAVASSSPHHWVDGHLQRLGLARHFEAILCAEDVAPGRTKPNPDLFQAALKALDAEASEAIVFEDSPNGITAGRAAGIFTVAVPNPLTAMLDIRGESLRLESLADVGLEEIIALASHRGR